MAQRPDIQYVTQFYTYGSEAKVLELKPAQKKQKAVLPKAKPQQKIRIMVDPVAWCGIALALVLVVLMIFSVQNYLDACEELQIMTTKVIELQNVNVQRQQEYTSLYDLADIEEKALALGMIPMEQAQVFTIHPVLPEPEPETRGIRPRLSSSARRKASTDRPQRDSSWGISSLLSSTSIRRHCAAHRPPDESRPDR